MIYNADAARHFQTLFAPELVGRLPPLAQARKRLQSPSWERDKPVEAKRGQAPVFGEKVRSRGQGCWV